MIEEPKLALIGSPGAGKTTAAEFLRKRFGHDTMYIIDGLDTENKYQDARETGFTIIRVAADQATRASRAHSPDIGEDPLMGLRHDYIVFNQGTRDLMYNQLLDVVVQEVAKF